MAQPLFQIHLSTDEDTGITSETIATCAGKDDISFFFPARTGSESADASADHQLSNDQLEYVTQIREHLSVLTKSLPWENFNSQINDLLMNNIYPKITEQNTRIMQVFEQRAEYIKQLQTAIANKSKQENQVRISIFAQAFVDDATSSDDPQTKKDKFQSAQLSYFAVQSLISILLILIKSAQKNDPTIVQEILALTGQLCEQLPMKCLASKNNFLYKSLQPLTTYIDGLSSTSDVVVSRQATRILLSFSIAKGSFKDMLPLLSKLVFNTSDVYDAHGLVMQLNNGLKETIVEWKKQKEQTSSEDEDENTAGEGQTELPSLTYLKMINAYPDEQLTQLNEDLLTGQFLSSIILAHLDIENEVYSPSEKFQLSSMSCEFHGNTLKDLFRIIEQLSAIQSLPSSPAIVQILTVCLRLFTTHLQLLADHQNDVSTYASKIELQNWFELLFKLACHDHSEETSISKEASKAFVHVMNIRTPSFTEKLSLIHQHIVEDQHPILITQLFTELNRMETLSNWIDSLCDAEQKAAAKNVLVWFTDRCFTEETSETMDALLFSFQQLLFYRLKDSCEKKTPSAGLSSLLTEYLTHVFEKCVAQTSLEKKLFTSILAGLHLMTNTEELFLYESVQPIFLSVLPLLAQYYLQNLTNEFLGCLLGKLSHALIIGSPQDPLEAKHATKLKLPLFAGGCITDRSDYLLKSTLAVYSQFQVARNADDEKDFLMSVYNNADEGARLMSKLKAFLRSKPQLLQKSIEQQANEACAAIFAVYLKLYRRINLAKSELSQSEQRKPYPELLSIYEYASRIQSVFATIKGQGGDCAELYRQIKLKTLFLLTSVRESDLIAVVKEDLPSAVTIDYKAKPGFHRQHSRWSKAKHVLKILRNLFQACIRFKRLMLEKKQTTEQKYDYDSLLHRTIDNFIYGDFYKTSTSVTLEEKQMEIDELEKCLCRQHERAMIRLMTYRFIRTFIENVLNHKESDRALNILSIYLPFMRSSDLQWSYFDNISAAGKQLSEEISHVYYSIVKLALPFATQASNFTQNVFYLLNLSYESTDICHLYADQIVERLFHAFVSSAKDIESNTAVGVKLTAYNWFRLFVFKLCETIELDKLRDSASQTFQQQQKFVFNTLIFNELKGLRSVTESNEQQNNSLGDVAINWFLQLNEIKESKLDLCINQYLVLLLQCMHSYKQVLSVCATTDYLQELLDIYRRHQSTVTRLLAMKLLRHLIPSISDYADGVPRNLIETFLADTLTAIGEKTASPEMIAELISMYRAVMSAESAWQTKAVELVCHSIQSHLNVTVMESHDSNEMIKLRASLNIMGGYIEPYRLGSIVSGELSQKSSDDSPLALIVEINETETPYLVQFLQTKQTASMTVDKLQLKTDVPPPNLPTTFAPLLDTLGAFISVDLQANTSVLLLELKRCAVSVLYHLLSNKTIIEQFMEKPYAPILAKLCLGDSLSDTRQRLADLRTFDKRHLQQYSLSLDRCERLKEISDDEPQETAQDPPSNDPDGSLCTTWKVSKTNQNPALVESLLALSVWKPYVSEGEMEYFKQGRIGNEEISIVSIPRSASTSEITQECGVKHRYRGRIAPSYENISVSFPTFVIDGLQLTEGNWYYSVRLPVGGVFQIGWATTDFTPSGSCGVGDDKYSWSYDGSRGVLFHEQGYYGAFDDARWKENDVCGCGIEIDGKNTKIKYWLNGKLLGTAFEHDKFIPLTATKCSLLPHGTGTIYYPAITIQWTTDPPRCCEVILSPEDMQDCPLPNGYKPLLLPKCISTENSIVDYPFSAYLVGDDQQESFVHTRLPTASTILRDFINERHLETAFSCDRNRLILPDDSNGFLLSVNNHEVTSLTISFDCQVSSSETHRNIRLFTFDSTEVTWETKDEQLRCVIILLSKRRQIKVYVNDKCQTFADAFSYEAIKRFNMHILPVTAAELSNLAVWKYALAEEQIHRLFNYGLFYIASDYKRLKDHRKQANSISFSENQRIFADATLLQFDAPFTEIVWEQKKEQAGQHESGYFRTHPDTGYSTVELFGSKTYLVLNKFDEEWSKYTLALELSIPQWPMPDEKLTLVVLNPQSTLFITSEGKLGLESDDASHESNSTVALNQYFRLTVCVQQESIHVYCNSKLELGTKFSDDRLQIKSNRIELFKEADPTKNTTNENTVRVSLKSITYLNQSISMEASQSPASLLPPLSVIGPSLMAMGYKRSWMQTIIEQHKPADITALHTLLREQKSQLIKSDLENMRKRCGNILSRLDASIDGKISSDLIGSANFDTDEQITGIAERLFTYWNSSQPSEQNTNFEIKVDANWFAQSVQDLDTENNIHRWIRDQSSTADDDDNTYELLNPHQAEQKSTPSANESIQYSHKNLSAKQFLESRIACEHGLTTVDARYTILNMLDVWSYDETARFPFEKFGDYTFLITLLKLFDSIKMNSDEKIDRVHLLIHSILKSEAKQLLASIDPIDQIDLPSKAPLLHHLQRDLVIHSVELLLRPALVNHPSNLDFAFKTLKLFSELITDKTMLKKHHLEPLIPILFPTPLINLIFHLFLIIPSHQSKVVIIQLFTTLLQTSGSILLNSHIQKFFCHFLIELSSKTIPLGGASKKKLGAPLADFVCILLAKQKTHHSTEYNQIQEFLAKVPEHIRNLFITSDVIDAWMDPAKQTPLPKEFLTQTKSTLEEKYKVTQEDFAQSNQQLNANADHDLINFMNSDSFLDDSFSAFMESLPTGSESNPTFYKNHLSLASVPADSVRVRAKFVYVLNKFIEDSLPLIDLNAAQRHSHLADQVRRIKGYLLSSTKFVCFNESLEKTECSYSSDYPSVHFDTVKASTDNEKSENTMFYQAYQQLQANAHQIFRRPNDQLWQAQYTGMHSTDSGGPYRDSITRICMDICSTRVPLFVMCPNGRTNSGSNRDCWIPNSFPPNKSIPNKFKRQYRFVGQLMGMAIRKKHYLDLKFPNLLWKQLLHEAITVEDVDAIDMQSFRIVTEMEKNIERIKSMHSNNDMESVFSSIMSELRFDVVSSSGLTFELIPGGSETPITASNFKHYCSLYRQYRLSEFNRQIDCIREGMCSIVPSYYLSLFTANELEEATCGKGRIDVELLKRNTNYSYDYSQESPPIALFWTVMNEMFTDEQKKLFLIFVWGRSTLPTRDEDFQTKFTITKLDIYGEEDADKTLPRSHTCFFTIDLPAYSTSDIMYERLNYAITCCSSIDADGTINDAPDELELHADDNLEE